MPQPVDISIVIPAFEEEESLPILDGEIHAAMAEVGRSYEVIYVDDGSTDGTAAVLSRLAAEAAAAGRIVRRVRLRRNQGQSAALAAGFRRARGEVVVTLDSDLQNDPTDIPRLLEALEGWDAVSGVRQRRRDTWVRRLSSRVANGVRSRVLGDGISDVGCSLKAYRAEQVRNLPFVFKGMHRFLPALVQMRGARVREIPVSHRPRRYGSAKYGIGNRLFRGLVDLAAVVWMRSRWIDARLEEELPAETARKAGKE